VTAEYREWPGVDLFPELGPTLGVLENRKDALIGIDREALEGRLRAYHDASISWDVVRPTIEGLGEDAARFDARKTREKVLREESFDSEAIRRLLVRPMDVRWCYYSSVRPLWNDPRPIYAAQCWQGNLALVTRRRGVANPEGIPFSITPILGAQHAFHKDAYYIPFLVRSSGLKPRSNFSRGIRAYLSQLGIDDADSDPQTYDLLWMHVLAIGYSSSYRTENAEALRPDWPHIPLPNSKTALLQSAVLGRKLAVLLDIETPLLAATTGTVRQVA
jgi:hypothetical protein